MRSKHSLAMSDDSLTVRCQATRLTLAPLAYRPAVNVSGKSRVGGVSVAVMQSRFPWLRLGYEEIGMIASSFCLVFDFARSFAILSSSDGPGERMGIAVSRRLGRSVAGGKGLFSCGVGATVIVVPVCRKNPRPQQILASY